MNMETSFVESYRLLARYNRWFNQRLYDACQQLSDEERKRDRGAFFGSVHNTLDHVIWADTLWLKRLAEQGVRFAALDAVALELPAGATYGTVLNEDWGGLRARREQLDIAIEEWLRDMPPDFPTRTVRYANLKGVQREHAAWIALAHFFNHQAHHRGQVTTLLSQAGIDPGPTDLVAMI